MCARGQVRIMMDNAATVTFMRDTNSETVRRCFVTGDILEEEFCWQHEVLVSQPEINGLAGVLNGNQTHFRSVSMILEFLKDQLNDRKHIGQLMSI